MRCISSVCSTCFHYFLVLGVLVYCVITILPITDAVAKYSPNMPPFKSDIDPIWFAHITDLHIADHNPISEKNLIDALKLFNKIDPEAIIVTGDLSDSYSKSTIRSFTKPSLVHWEKYQNIRDQYLVNKSKLFEVAGNHDSWGIIKFNSSNNYANKYLPHGINEYAWSQEFGDVRLVGFHPFYPPIATGDAFNYLVYLRYQVLDAIEKELQKPTKSKYTIVCTHVTTEMFFPVSKTSRTKKDYIGVLNSNNVMALLDGHTHPPKAQFRVFENYTECTQQELQSNRVFGLATIDNGRFSYSTIKIDDDVKAAVTFPIPDDIATHTEDSKFEFRMIVFSQNDDLTFDVEGYGKMQKKRNIKGGASLWTLEANVPHGNHHLKISGSANIEFDYSVGEKQGKGKVHVRDRPFNPEMFIPAYIFLMLLGYFTLFPITNNWVDSGERFLIGLSDKGFFKAIICGPSITARRLRRFSKSLLWILRIMYFLSGFAPFFFFKVDGVLSILTPFGYIIGGTFRFDSICTYYVDCFLMFIFIPLVNIISFAPFGSSWLFLLLLLPAVKAVSYGWEFWVDHGLNIDPDRWLGLWAPLFCVYVPILLVATVWALAMTRKHRFDHPKKE